MKKWFCIALLAVFMSDAGVDMFGIGNHMQAACPPCQASICQVHIGAPSSPVVQLPISNEGWRVGTADTPLFSQLFVKFFFHPPRLSA